MVDTIDNDKPLTTISITGAMKMLILALGWCVYINSAKLLQKAGLFDEEKDDDSDDPFSIFKHKIEQL